MKKSPQYKYFLKKRREELRTERKQKEQNKYLKKKGINKTARNKEISKFFSVKKKKKSYYKGTSREKRIEIPNDKAHKPGEVISYFAQT